jgi:hypothetical protein
MITDYFGFELKIGDKVIYPDGNFMEYGIIKSFYGNKNNHIEILIPNGEERVKHGNNVIKHDTVMLALKDVYAENFV